MCRYRPYWHQASIIWHVLTIYIFTHIYNITQDSCCKNCKAVGWSYIPFPCETSIYPISHPSKQLGNIDWQYWLAMLTLQRNKLNGGQLYILLSTFSVFFLIFLRTLKKLLFPKFELSLDNFCNDQLEVCQFYRAMIAQLFSTFTINCNPSKLTFFNLPLKKVSLFL